MRNEQQFSNLIYEYFLLNIHLGCYKYESTLPSIETLCHEFGVSSQTVKAALQRLRAEGYIAMHNGRSTKVLFQETEQERAEFIRRYYSQRCDAFPDLYRTGEQVVIPLLAEGIRRMDDEDLSYIAQLSERAGSNELMLFYCFTLQKIKNPLIMNFFWESVLFQAFPFIQGTDDASIHNSSVTRDSLQGIIDCKRAEDWAGVNRILYSFQRDGFEKAYRFIKAEHCICPAPRTEQIPFTWRIYRGHPQLCYSLALHLLHEIYMGEYRGAEFLPSYEKMSEKYGASVSTMRRTVRLLGQLGVVKSINGRGTYIYPIRSQCPKPDFTSPGVRNNLAFFYQAFELIIYSCETAARDTLQALTPAEHGELLSKLEGYQVSGGCEFSLWCILITIAMHSPLQGVREIYRKLYGLFLWGYPLEASYDGLTERREAVQFTGELILALKGYRSERCAELVRDQVEQLFPLAERYLRICGIKTEELRITSSIRLPLKPMRD